MRASFWWFRHSNKPYTRLKRIRAANNERDEERSFLDLWHAYSAIPTAAKKHNYRGPCFGRRYRRDYDRLRPEKHRRDTTAHLTYVTDVELQKLTQNFGEDHAQAAGDARAAAVDEIDRIVREEEIGCLVRWNPLNPRGTVLVMPHVSNLPVK